MCYNHTMRLKESTRTKKQMLRIRDHVIRMMRKGANVTITDTWSVQEIAWFLSLTPQSVYRTLRKK